MIISKIVVVVIIIVTQTDVVRAGTRDVAKILQILYDVNAVSGPGSYTYLGVTHDNKKSANQSIMYPNGLENSPSMNTTNFSTSTGTSTSTSTSTSYGIVSCTLYGIESICVTYNVLFGRYPPGLKNSNIDNEMKNNIIKFL